MAGSLELLTARDRLLDRLDQARETLTAARSRTDSVAADVPLKPDERSLAKSLKAELPSVVTPNISGKYLIYVEIIQ